MNNEQDYNPEFLESIFDRIAALPFQLTGDVSSMQPKSIIIDRI